MNYKLGEKYAYRCLEANGYTVLDRSDQPQYWKKDIDLTAIKGSYAADIEVKWDQCIANTGNMFFELLTNLDTQQNGWANYTQCDFIFYGDAQQLIFYVFSADDMRQFLRTHQEDYETRIANDYNYRDGTIYKQSVGAIVPLSNFMLYYPVQIIDIKDRLKLNQF